MVPGMQSAQRLPTAIVTNWLPRGTLGEAGLCVVGGPKEVTCGPVCAVVGVLALQ